MPCLEFQKPVMGKSAVIREECSLVCYCEAREEGQESKQLSRLLPGRSVHLIKDTLPLVESPALRSAGIVQTQNESSVAEGRVCVHCREWAFHQCTFDTSFWFSWFLPLDLPMSMARPCQASIPLLESLRPLAVNVEHSNTMGLSCLN